MLQADIQKTISQTSEEKLLQDSFAETDGQGNSVMTNFSLFVNRFFSSPTSNFHATLSISCSPLQMNNALKTSYCSKYVAIQEMNLMTRFPYADRRQRTQQ